VCVIINTIVQPHKRSQVSRHGTDRSSPRGTQMPTEGTGQKSLLLWSNTMAKVTYRGVSYDTDTRKAKQTQKVEETYRGVKFQKELIAA